MTNDTITATVNSDDPDIPGIATVGAVADDVTAKANNRPPKTTGPDVTVSLPGVRIGGRENIRVQLSVQDTLTLARRLRAAAEEADG